MEKLIQKYNRECDIIPRTSNNVWKLGVIISLIIFIISYFYTKNYALINIKLIAELLILYMVCEFININKLKKILNIKGKVKKRDIYLELDKMQKKWIIKYCKKNKIDRIEKVKIIRDEVKNKDKELRKKYIDPIILATLLLNIWGIVVEKLDTKIGTINAIIISIALAVIICLIIEFGKNEYRQQRELFNAFQNMTGLKRLDELLVYVAIRCNK